MPAVAALSEVDICNMALSHIGVNTSIASFNDQNPAATACSFWYPKMRNWLLQSAPWNFADTNALLTTDTTTVPGYNFVYQVPDDSLQPVAVTGPAGQRNGTMYWSNYWWPYPPFDFGFPKIPFKQFESTMNPGSLCLACDVPSLPTTPLYLFYIQCVTNTALFDPMFSDCLSLYVGSRIGKSLRADQARVGACAQEAAAMKMQALAQHLNAAQQDPERQSPSILVRG